jgi:hypothetical protein
MVAALGALAAAFFTALTTAFFTLFFAALLSTRFLVRSVEWPGRGFGRGLALAGALRCLTGVVAVGLVAVCWASTTGFDLRL